MFQLKLPDVPIPADSALFLWACEETDCYGLETWQKCLVYLMAAGEKRETGRAMYPGFLPKANPVDLISFHWALPPKVFSSSANWTQEEHSRSN